MTARPEFDSRGRQRVKKGWIVKGTESMKKIALMAVVAMVGAGVSVRAQAPPQMSPATAEAQQAQPQAPTPPAAPVNPFPAVNPKNFTATTPTVAEVNDFLKVVWGYSQERIWSVAAIQKTPAPGVVRVVVFAASKADPSKVNRNEFFVTPDGKHAIADAVIDFGVKPFADRRATLQERADGPGEGAASKQLLLVEFADLLNEKSKDAQDTIDNLVKDFPQARLVVENLPSDSGPYAFRAAAEGVCVRKAKGDAAFFTYVQAVFSKQQGLTAATLEPALGAAVTAAGGDPASVAACADSQAAKDDVKASIALGAEVGIDQAPVLVVNGRVLPLSGAPYETLKHIVAYQAQLDGITVNVQPTLSTLK
jgi:protein-disulfide isomerase